MRPLPLCLKLSEHFFNCLERGINVLLSVGCRQIPAAVREQVNATLQHRLNKKVPHLEIRIQSVAIVQHASTPGKTNVKCRTDAIDQTWNFLFGSQPGDAGLQLFATLVKLLHSPASLRGEHPESRVGCGKGNGMAVECSRVDHALLRNQIHDSFAPRHRADWKTCSQGFAQDRKIRRNVKKALGSPERRAKAGDHLIKDQDDFVALREAPHFLEITWDGEEAATIAQYWFRDDGRDFVAVLPKGGFEDVRVIPRQHVDVPKQRPALSFRSGYNPAAPRLVVRGMIA